MDPISIISQAIGPVFDIYKTFIVGLQKQIGRADLIGSFNQAVIADLSKKEDAYYQMAMMRQQQQSATQRQQFYIIGIVVVAIIFIAFFKTKK